MSVIQSHVTRNGGAWPFPPGQASTLTGEGYGEDPARGRVAVELEQDLVGGAVHCFLGQAPGENSKLRSCLLWPIPAGGKKVLACQSHYDCLLYLWPSVALREIWNGQL